MRRLFAGFDACFFISVGSSAERIRSDAACRRNKTLYLRAAIGAGRDLQDTPDDAGAILHDAKTHSARTGSIEPKAAAIILDAQSEVSWLCRQPDFDCSWLSMLDG